MSQSKLNSKILIAVLSTLVLLMSAAIGWNLVLLQREVGERTRRYVSDVSVQLTKDIDNRLSKTTSDLISVSDSLLQIGEYESDEFRSYLKRKSAMMGFTSIVVAGTGRDIYQTNSNVENLYSLPGIQQSLDGKNGVSFLDAQSVLYSVPVMRNGEVVGALGGIRDKENMQALIQPESFSGESLTCIVDRTWKVIISPTELSPFMQLDNLFEEDPQGEVARNINRMRKDMERNQAGVFRFKAVDGADLLLSYNPLQSYDWVLLTLVPSNVLSVKIDSYMNRTVLIMLCTIALMAAILFILYMSRRSHYRQIERIAFIDRVTGGMNNTSFQVKCEAKIPKAPPGTYSIVLLNIKNFKLINQQFGSERGDNVLRVLMGIIQTRVEGRGFEARANADNFFICLKAGRRDQIQRVVDEILDDVEEEVRKFNQHREVPYHFVLQSGVYIVDEPALDITIMQDRAKYACENRTSSEDGICKFYDSAITKRLEKEQELNGLFEGALAHGEFQVYLQPKVHMKDGTVGGAEALVRWPHPQRGIIYPSDFIPLFEVNGNICALDLYVFEQVCKKLRDWRRCGKTLIPISVNLSRQHFKHPSFLEKFSEIARRYDIPRGLIELELTESIFFDDQSIAAVKGYVEEMHRLGFLCSLDDFGAGYSSLGLLMEFDIDTIKLDRRFFLDVSKPKARHVVAAVMDLSGKIGARTVAEGIETPEQLEFLRNMHCDMIQGYIYSKPLPIPEFEAWLEKRERRAGEDGNKE